MNTAISLNEPLMLLLGGVLALLGPRCPDQLRVFLLALAIVDDIGAVAAIALFCTDEVDVLALLAAVALFGFSRIPYDTTFPVSDVRADYLTDVLPGIALFGLGLSATVAPLTTTVLGAAPDNHAGLASGVNNAVARTGGLLLVAVLPALTGLGGGGFGDAAALEPAFRTAMVVCAALLAAGTLITVVAVRSPAPGPAAREAHERADCPRRHCAIDASPSGVTGSAR